MVFIFCKYSSTVEGASMHLVASARTMGLALERLRKRYAAGMAVHHPNHGKALFYANTWQGSLQPLITA